MNMILRRLLIVVILSSVSAAAWAAAEDAFLSRGAVFVKNVTVIDGLGNPPVKGQDILIENGKVAAITGTGEASAPAGATIIEGDGLTAMPGLIDLHIHLAGGWTGGLVMRDKYPRSTELAGIQQTLASYLYSGVTTVLDVGNVQPLSRRSRRSRTRSRDDHF